MVVFLILMLFIFGASQELNTIVDSLAKRDLQPALDWARRNRAELKEKGTTSIVRMASSNAIELQSSLEMKLHKLQFVELLRQGRREEAVNYARFCFPQFVESHEREIQARNGTRGRNQDTETERKACIRRFQETRKGSRMGLNARARPLFEPNLLPTALTHVLGKDT